ncbi:MAG: thiamine pyrophosphate-dependent enzyme [Terracidiphilus sp.]|nr:thiamine pyrophosphate-dependent enzyme [Terracidiphilus sp.]
MTASMQEFASVDQGFSLISNSKLLALYSAMVACRRLAEQSRGQTNGWRRPAAAESLLGHEAAVVGAAIDLLPHDTVAPALWPPAALRAVNPVAAAATGFIAAARQALAEKPSHKTSLFFSGGHRRAHASWMKALVLAAEHNLPILFVLLNGAPNLALPAPGEAIPLNRKGYDLPLISVDGNDVVAVYRVASEAIAHARRGNGPALIDCRLSIPADPLQNMQKYLIEKGLDPAEFSA